MSEPSRSDITMLIRAAGRGDSRAAERLLPLIYSELHAMARAQMVREAAGHTLQPTALVHEAYLRLAGEAEPTWESRAHFFGAAAEAMRRVLVEHARSKARVKRGFLVGFLGCGGTAPSWHPRSELLAVSPDTNTIALIEAESGRHVLKLEPPELAGISWIEFSHDGGAIAVATKAGRVDLWNLRELAAALRELGLAWDVPEPDAAPPAQRWTSIRMASDP